MPPQAPTVSPVLDPFAKIAELNLGQTAAIPANPIVGQPGVEVRLLMIPPLDSRSGQVNTVHLSTRFPNNVDPSANPNLGPLTGIVEFSSGGAALERIEFDMPGVRPWGENYSQQAGTTLPRRSLANGLSFPVPAAGLNVLVRNDGSLRPVNDPTVTIGSLLAVQASAHIVKLPIAAKTNLKKTVYCVVTAGVPLAAGALITIGIPSYAVRARFMRNLLSRPLSVTVVGSVGPTGIYLIPTGSVLTADGNPLELSPQDQTMVITNDGALSITSLAVVFDLEI